MSPEIYEEKGAGSESTSTSSRDALDLHKDTPNQVKSCALSKDGALPLVSWTKPLQTVHLWNAIENGIPGA